MLPHHGSSLNMTRTSNLINSSRSGVLCYFGFSDTKDLGAMGYQITLQIYSYRLWNFTECGRKKIIIMFGLGRKGCRQVKAFIDQYMDSRTAATEEMGK